MDDFSKTIAIIKPQEGDVVLVESSRPLCDKTNADKIRDQIKEAFSDKVKVLVYEKGEFTFKIIREV